MMFLKGSEGEMSDGARKIGAALVVAVLAMVMASPALANDLQNLNDSFTGLGQDRTDQLSIVSDIVVTGVRIMEDFLAPAMGVALLLGAVNEGARHGDIAGALRYAVGGILCFGIPYLIDLALVFGT
jgi:hypothetical protein